MHRSILFLSIIVALGFLGFLFFVPGFSDHDIQDSVDVVVGTPQVLASGDPLRIPLDGIVVRPGTYRILDEDLRVAGPLNTNGRDVLDISIVSIDGTPTLDMQPKGTLKPGRYEVSGRIETPEGVRDFSQDFYWGVLAMNFSQSRYKVGDSARIDMAVLDDEGNTLCGSSLHLGITTPQGDYFEYSTRDGQIVLNELCGPNNVIDEADYFTELVLQETGVYQFVLTAETSRGARTVQDYVEVAAELPYRVTRSGPTRIWPLADYEMQIRITANQDFEGSIQEFVPDSFEITNFKQHIPNKFQIQHSNNQKIIIWNVDIHAGETLELSYTFDAPDISPEFYLLGPLQLRTQDTRNKDTNGSVVFEEARQWQVASDAIVFNDTFTEASNTNLPDHTPDTGAGWTRIIEVGVCTLAIDAAADTLAGDNSGDDCGASEGALYEIDDTLSTANYEVIVTSTVGDTNDDYNWIACRVQDSNNFYAYQWNEDNGQLHKRTSGTFSHLGSATAGVVNGSEVKLICNGSTISVEDDASETVSVSDSDHSGAGKAGIGMGDIEGGTDDVSTQQLDNFQVNTLNTAPTISSVTDTPDPTNPGRSVTFITDWSDADDIIKVKVCQTNSLTNQVCDGGVWASSTVFTVRDPEYLVYDVVGDDAGETRNYWVFVCDDDAACSSSTVGSFTVNSVTNKENILIRGGVDIR